MRIVKRICLLACLIGSCVVVSLLSMSMVIDRVMPVVIQRSALIQTAVTRVVAALGLLTVKIGVEHSTAQDNWIAQSMRENTDFIPAPLIFLHDQLQEITKQQLLNNNNNKNKKQDPKNSSTVASVVTSVLVTKFKQECKKHKQYFLHKLTENKALIEKIAQDIGIKIKSIDIEHIFKPISKINGSKLSGGHSTHLEQFGIEKILQGVDPKNNCYTALIRMVNNANRVITDTKSQFPSCWDGQKIIDTLFTSIPTIKRVIHATNGKWLLVKDAHKQTYRIFVDSKGLIRTFFPEI